MLGDALGAGIVQHLSRDDLNLPEHVTHDDGVPLQAISDCEDDAEKMTCV